MKPLKTRLINALTATAISLAAITSGTAPVAAKDDDTLKIIAGIAAVAAFAGILNQQQNQGTVGRGIAVPLQPAQPVGQDRDPRWQEERWHAERWQSDRWRDDDWRRGLNDDRRGPRLPGICALEFGHAARPAIYYAESCLRREGAAFGLPQFCAQQIRSRRFQGRAFEAECLRNAGYRTELRR
jgi:hypothetical protein